MAANKTTCPICKTPASMTEHCGSKVCNWTMCLNKKCQARLDASNRRGHALLDLVKRYKDNTGSTVSTRRLTLVSGVWVDRDVAR